jgi:hypothetical protein
MTIDHGFIHTDVKDCAWGDEAKTIILTQTKFENQPDYLPFGAMATDSTAHGQAIFQECIEGKWGEIAPFDESALSPSIRYQRRVQQGLTVTFESSPALSGIYAVTDADVGLIAQEAQFIGLFGTFANDSCAIVKDATGVLRSFSSTTVYLSFAKAVMQYAAALRQAYTNGTPYPAFNEVAL